MTSKIRTEGAEILRFGGGINSRSSEDQIDPLECTSGENFILDPGNGEFRPRGPFNLVGAAPNGAEIRGFVTLQKSDGTVTMLVQAGANVYSWDGDATFTLVGTVAPLAKLRGPREANWALDDKVIITDINLQEEVHEWDGTTFDQVDFLQSDGSSAFGAFRARYCIVENERAFYANIHDNGSEFQHLLVSSKRGDYTIVSADDRPSNALAADDPWFLPVPQLKPINGLAFAFGILAISQSNGAFEKLTGSNAQDFALEKLHDGSGASGFESVVATSNDIVYGSPGRIESLEATDKFGDVEFDDLSFKIRPDIIDFTGWTLAYNPRLKRIYCFPDDQQEVWVLHIDFVGTDLSPWSKWTTRHEMSFQPTAVMVCRDPADGLEYTFMGDSSGNIYRLEGTGEDGDGGTDDVEVNRISKLFTSPLDTKMFHINGWLTQRKLETSATVTLRFLFSGEHAHDIEKEITTSAVVFDTPYGGAVYYGGLFYYGAKQLNRLVRKLFGVPGFANQVQIEISVEGQDDFSIPEIGIRFDSAG